MLKALAYGLVGAALMWPAHAQDTTPPAAEPASAPWVIAATIMLDDIVIDELYFAHHAVRDEFATEAKCKAFLDSGDAELNAANNGLKAGVEEQFGSTAVVVVSCKQVAEDSSEGD